MTSCLLPESALATSTPMLPVAPITIIFMRYAFPPRSSSLRRPQAGPSYIPNSASEINAVAASPMAVRSSRFLG